MTDIDLQSLIAQERTHCARRCSLGPQAYCPAMWRRVFTTHLGTPPTGDDDPRWDQLLAIGLPHQREIE